MSLRRSEPADAGDDQALHRNDQRYRNLVEVSPDAILLNRGGRVVLANPACARLFGAREPADLIGRVALDLFHPDFHGIIGGRIAEVIAGKNVPLVEERIIRLDGQVRDVEVVAAPCPEGDEVCVQVILRDITDRKRAEAAQQESEQRARTRAVELQAVLDTVPSAVWIARDAQGSLIETNRFGADMLRRQPGTNVSLTAPPGERPMNFRMMRDGGEVQPDELPIQAAARLGQEFRDAELDLVFDDGTVRHLLGNSAPILGEDGQPRGSVGAFVDITERKNAEARAESLARFPRENPDPVIRVAADLTVLYANDAACAHLGDLGLEVGRAAPRELAEASRQALASGRRIKVEFDCRGVVFQVSVVPVGHEVNLYAQDVTAQKAAEDALRVEARRKTEFLAVLSHELRNPLASLLIGISLLERAPPESETARRAKAILHRQGAHLSRLVDDLLDLSRVTHGKIEIRRARIDTRAVVRRVCDDLKHSFEEHGVELYCSEPAHPVWVDADEARVVQMVGNLLGNALKFTAPEGQVHVAVRKRGATCEVSVQDSGVGIEACDLDSVFDPFMQAERTRHGARGGMGIGLALVRELAVSHGGWVRALSAGSGHGAELILTIPLALKQAGAGIPASEARVGPRASGLSIQIIEDDDDARESLSLLLTLDGHDVNVASNGHAGVEAVSARHPDVVICDVGLPDLDGLDVIRAIRIAHPEARIFAIALTGHAQQQDRARALEAGFDAHLAKPPDYDALGQILKEAVRRKSA